MTRLRPHQKPILTRFAFVMPLMPATRTDVVPCEPGDATNYAVVTWHPWTRNFNFVSETFPAGAKGYKAAQARAQELDKTIAAQWGVKR